jgi:glycosyltransferase involved in cell wall biosynthesis
MNKRIGILCSSNSSGGLELNTARLAKWLQERGWEITLYGLASSPLASMALKDNIHFTVIGFPKKYLDITGALKLAGKIKRDNINFLFVCTNSDLSIASWTKLFSGKNLKLIYQQHMQVGITKKDVIHTLRYSSIDIWLTPANYLAKEVTAKTNLNPAKIRIVPFGIETKKFTPSAYSRKEARDILHLPQNKIIIGIIGRLDPLKGQHIVIEALHKLKQYEDLELMIMGETTQGEHANYKSQLIELGERYQIKNKIHFRPFNEHVQIAFAAIDIFIMASRDETYGMVTIEAMAARVPIIGTNAGGTKELLDNGKLGLLFNSENGEELAEKIDWVLKNSEASETISLAAQKNVCENYSHTKECELIEDILFSINN